MMNLSCPRDKVEPEMSDAEVLRSELEGLSRTTIAISAAFCSVVREATVSIWVKVFRINPEFRILRLTFQESQPQNAELGRF